MLALRDIMTRDVVTVSPDLSLRDAMELLTSRHITGAPVVANGRVVGVVSLTDLAEFAAATPGVPTERPELAEWGDFDEPVDWPEGDEPPSTYFAHLWDDAGAEVAERLQSTSGPEWNALEEHTVDEAMNRVISSLPASTPVQRAAEMMQRSGIHRVIVMDDDKLVGVVTTKDISDLVADERFTKRVYVFDKRRRE
jgi:CBS domain-containing protein